MKRRVHEPHSFKENPDGEKGRWIVDGRWPWSFAPRYAEISEFNIKDIMLVY